MRTAIVASIVDNDVGRLLEDLILEGGVDMRHVIWIPFDGVGFSTRNALNFTERGFGVRSAIGCSDRGHSPTSQLTPGQIDWGRLFVDEGVRWFHTGGIFAGLGKSTADVAIEAVSAAHDAGAVVSYDLNYRDSLWRAHGGRERAREVNRRIAEHVDVMLGNEEDFVEALGFEIAGVDQGYSALDPACFRDMIEKVVAKYPNLRYVATSLRAVRSATVNDWGAILFADGEFYEATHRPGLEILDRVGGGDSFASGLIYGLLSGKTPGEAVEYGAAHGALAMTTPGDTSSASLAEVERVVKGGAARVVR